MRAGASTRHHVLAQRLDLRELEHLPLDPSVRLDRPLECRPRRQVQGAGSLRHCGGERPPDQLTGPRDDDGLLAGYQWTRPKFRHMVEVIVCDEDGTKLTELGRRFHDFAAPGVLIDGCTYKFLRFKAPGVVLYRRPDRSDSGPPISTAASPATSDTPVSHRAPVAIPQRLVATVLVGSSRRIPRSQDTNRVR